MQNPTTLMVKRQKFRILKIHDGGQICTETSRTQMLTIHCWSTGQSSRPSGDTLV